MNESEKLNQEIMHLLHGVMKRLSASTSIPVKIDHETMHLTMIQWSIIRLIHEHKEISMKKLAEIMNVTPPSMTEHIDALVSQNLIERDKSSLDRRTVLVKISDKGEQLFNKLYSEKMKVFNKILSTLSIEEKQSFLKMLQKVSASCN